MEGRPIGDAVADVHTLAVDQDILARIVIR
jgi:hypothetical protein